MDTTNAKRQEVQVVRRGVKEVEQHVAREFEKSRKHGPTVCQRLSEIRKRKSTPKSLNEKMDILLDGCSLPPQRRKDGAWNLGEAPVISEDELPAFLWACEQSLGKKR